jgi:hypothetical protein
VTFTVVWDEEAEAGLAAVWLASADRDAVTRAAYELEERLRTDPANVGESREVGERVAFEKPLGLRFKIVGGTTVRVGVVWAFR